MFGKGLTPSNLSPPPQFHKDSTTNQVQFDQFDHGNKLLEYQNKPTLAINFLNFINTVCTIAINFVYNIPQTKFRCNSSWIGELQKIYTYQIKNELPSDHKKKHITSFMWHFDRIRLSVSPTHCTDCLNLKHLQTPHNLIHYQMIKR